MKGKEFYIMLADPPWAGPSAKVTSGPDLKVYTGERIQGVDEPVKILLNVDAKAPKPLDFPPLDIHGPNRTLLFSQKFMEILQKLDVKNVQYFDAEVTYEPDDSKHCYKVANVIGWVRGLDIEKSDLISSPQGNVVSIEQMCLDEEQFSGQKMFRLQEDSMLIIVHRCIKEAVEAAGLQGFMFITDDEYEPGMI